MLNISLFIPFGFLLSCVNQYFRNSIITAITAVKHEMQLQEWTAQIEAQQASGMTVQKWCKENGINPKTYYYRLRRVRERCVDTVAAIVPVNIPQQRSDIRIEKNGLQISLPTDIAQETLIALVHELC